MCILCILVGIRDAKLSEKLQLDPNLTLDKMVTQVRQNEEVKRQQPKIRQEKSEVKEVNVDAVMTKRMSKAKTTSQKAEWTAQRTHSTFNKAQKTKQMEICKRCGKIHNTHRKRVQPENQNAENSERKDILLQYANQLKDQKQQLTAHMNQLSWERSKPKTKMWQQKILVNKELITFKVDTSAAVTAIAASMYSTEKQGKLTETKKMILGPNSTPLNVMGTFRACLQKYKKSIWQDVYVVTDLVMPLVGLLAIPKLQLLQQVVVLDEPGEQYKAMFP